MFSDFMSFFIAFLSFCITYVVFNDYSLRQELIQLMSRRLRDVSVVKQHEEEEPQFFRRILDFMSVTDYEARLSPEKAAQMRDWLSQAGYRSTKAINHFYGRKIVLCAVFGIVFFVVFGILNPLDFTGPLQAVMPLAGIAIGHLISNFEVDNKISERKAAVQHGMPDLLDLLVVCSEAGLGLQDSLKRIALELKSSHAILSKEIDTLNVELRMMHDRTIAFDNFEKRVQVKIVSTFCSTLVQAIEYGTPLGNTLRNIAEETRKERIINAETKAAKIPALMTLPLILFILPTLFIVILAPIIVRTASGG